MQKKKRLVFNLMNTTLRQKLFLGKQLENQRRKKQGIF